MNRAVFLKQVTRWVSSVTVKDVPTNRTFADGYVGCRKPTTFWLQGSLANHQAARVKERSKIGIDCACPAACIIIGQLFEALNVHRKEMSRPQGGI